MKFNQKFPWTTLAGENDGLSITLKRNPAIDYTDACLGLRFAVHNVDEMIADFDSDLVEIKHGMTLDVLITPEVMETDEDLRSFSVSERQCYMEGERKLKFFKKYSVRNCEMECLSSFTFKKCGCVPFYVVRNSTLPICGVDNNNMTSCIPQAAIEVKVKEEAEIKKNCNCLPTCNTLTYKLEYFYNEIKYSDDVDKITINFRFKNGDYMPQRRFRQLTALGLMAESAGLLGLYCGVSILTFIELFYFFTLRPATNFIKKMMHKD